MGLAELFILAVGLAMDAFAVSICKGVCLKKASLAQSAAGSCSRLFSMCCLKTRRTK